LYIEIGVELTRSPSMTSSDVSRVKKVFGRVPWQLCPEYLRGAGTFWPSQALCLMFQLYKVRTLDHCHCCWKLILNIFLFRCLRDGDHCDFVKCSCDAVLHSCKLELHEKICPNTTVKCINSGIVHLYGSQWPHFSLTYVTLTFRSFLILLIGGQFDPSGF
jgi:hypothetical protein